MQKQHLSTRDHILSRFVYDEAGEEIGKIYDLLAEPESNQIKIVFFDDLEKRPRQFIRSIFKFLNVSDSFVPSIIKKRVNQGLPVKDGTEKNEYVRGMKKKTRL